MVYLDNAATTHKKPRAVLRAVKQGLNKYSVNSGRSGYQLCIEAGLKVLALRQNAASFFGLENIENVIITKSCTEAINLGMFSSAKDGGHIVISAYEHNSVARTVQYLKDTKGIEFSVAYPDKYGRITIENIKSKIQKNTYMVAINHTSNVTGATQDIKQIGKFCESNKLIFLVDAAQSAGHEKINMEKCCINLLAIAGHKSLYGPQGIGLLLINKTTLKSPIIFGGTGTKSESIKQPKDLPDSFESGTQNLPGILGLDAGICFVEKKFEKINKKILTLTRMLVDGLSKIKDIEIYAENIKSGVVSINIKNKDNNEVAGILDEKYKICIRNGLHCAPLIHSHLGTIDSGLIRISIGYYNNKRDIKYFLKCILKCIK